MTFSQHTGNFWALPGREGIKQYFVFNVLPFGLVTACYAFTKLLHTLVRYRRSQSIRVVLYLDDGIVAVKGEQAVIQVSKQVRGDLVKAGLVENTAKSSWQPTKQLEWLGFIVDLSQVPVRKIEQLQQLLTTINLKRKWLPAKMLASVIRKIISMSPALDTVARFKKSV